MNYPRLTFHEKLNYPSHTYTTPDINEDIIKLFDKVAKAQKLRSPNYHIDDVLKSRTLCYTVTIVDGHPVLGSLAWTRPMYNGVIRLCTRYCIDPDWSMINFGKGTDGLRIDTIDHIIQQLDFCKKLGYTDFFIGRNERSNGRRTKKLAKQISKYTDVEWYGSDEEVLCAMDINDDQCWQYIIYNNKKDFDYESELTA